MPRSRRPKSLEASRWNGARGIGASRRRRLDESRASIDELAEHERSKKGSMRLEPCAVCEQELVRGLLGRGAGEVGNKADDRSLEIELPCTRKPCRRERGDWLGERREIEPRARGDLPFASSPREPPGRTDFAEPPPALPHGRARDHRGSYARLQELTGQLFQRPSDTISGLSALAFP